MSSISITPNHREIIAAQSTITGKEEYLKSTNGALNTTATIGGLPIPVTGATTAIPTAIVDASGNQITSFGGGTQYTDGGVPPAHPIGNTIEWSDGSNWQTVSTAKPLPVSASLTNPTIGAAVPATGNYIAASKAGTLTGLLLGSQTSANSLAVVVASDQGTVPVSASSLPLPTLAATSTKQSDGTQKTQIVDGSGNVIASTSNALNVALTSGSAVIGHVITDSGSVANATLQAGSNAVGFVGTSPNTINVGQQTVNTTAVQLSASATVPTNGILVQALSTNSASIFVGGSGVTTSTGWELQPGQCIAFTCTLNTIYIRSTASTTDKVCYQVL